MWKAEDIIFVKNVLHNIFQKHSINLIPIPYQTTRNHEVKKHIRASRANHDYVLLSDLDSHTYPCITSRKDQRIRELDGEITSDKIIIVVEELESWCLAGIDPHWGICRLCDSWQHWWCNKRGFWWDSFKHFI